MSKLLRLLKQKNHFLEKFYNLNVKELDLLTDGSFDHLDEFYQNREDILAIVQKINSHIEKCPAPLPELHSAVTEAFKVRDDLVATIVNQDMDMLSLIEGARNSIIKELSSVNLTKKALSGYKAPKIRRGLDEEA